MFMDWDRKYGKILKKIKGKWFFFFSRIGLNLPKKQMTEQVILAVSGTLYLVHYNMIEIVPSTGAVLLILIYRKPYKIRG